MGSPNLQPLNELWIIGFSFKLEAWCEITFLSCQKVLEIQRWSSLATDVSIDRTIQLEKSYWKRGYLIWIFWTSLWNNYCENWKVPISTSWIQSNLFSIMFDLSIVEVVFQFFHSFGFPFNLNILELKCVHIWNSCLQGCCLLGTFPPCLYKPITIILIPRTSFVPIFSLVSRYVTLLWESSWRTKLTWCGLSSIVFYFRLYHKVSKVSCSFL